MIRRFWIGIWATTLVALTACSGGCNFEPGAECAGADLSGQDLSNQGAEEADLSGADLSEANLHASNLTDATLARANLSGAQLTDADLSRADLTRADLREADLSGAILAGADLTGADLTGAVLHGQFSGVSPASGQFLGVSLASTNLSQADLAGADLSGASLSEANLAGADLSGAQLLEADLRSAILTDADLSGSGLVGADLSEADLSGANLSGANLQLANLTGTELTEVEVEPEFPDFTASVGLGDEALASMVGVDVARLSRTLTERKIFLEEVDFRMLSRLAGACLGSAVTDAGTSFSEGFHAAVDVQTPSSRADLEESVEVGVGVEPAGYLPPDFFPSALRFAELVLCVEDERGVQIGECGPYTGPGPTRIPVYQSRITARLVDARSGEEVARRGFAGSAEPGPCPSLTDAEAFYNSVRGGAVRAFVRPFIFAD